MIVLSVLAQQYLALLTNAYLVNVPPDNGPIPIPVLLDKDRALVNYYNLSSTPYKVWEELRDAGFVVGDLFHPEGYLLDLIGAKLRLPDGRPLGDVPTKELTRLVWEGRREQARRLFGQDFNGRSIHED